MTLLHKLKILKWVSSNFVGSHKTVSSSVRSLFYIAENPRLYGTKRAVQIENGESINPISDATRKEAQAALLEYFRYTRNLQYTDAENMSKNSPHFLEKLLAKFDMNEDVGNSVTRFLRYHPINEFEPFFESLGLKPHEYSPLLPPNLMFLCDDELMLANYHALCNYGVARSKIGKIYKEASEVFGYDNGVVALKLKAYEALGLTKSFIIKLVVSSSYLLIGEENKDFIKVLGILRLAGVKINRIEQHLSQKGFYDWSKLLALLNLFKHRGFNEEQLGGMMNHHLGIWFGDSVDRIYLLIGFFLKFGSTMNQIFAMFSQFPPMKFEKFVSNLRHCFVFMNEIEMEADEIGNIFCFYPLLLGSCQLKKARSLVKTSKAGKKQICEVIRENPQVLKEWVMGSKVEPFAYSEKSLAAKPNRYHPLLPPDLMSLCDDELLLENYYVLRNYGIARSKIGKIYKEATEVFGYANGVLALKLKAYEGLGLSQPFMIKLVVCTPYLLIGEVNVDFVKVLEILRKAGVEISRIEQYLSEKSSYDWSKLLALLNLFRHNGYSEEKLGGMMNQHLGIWFEDSVDRIYLLIGFLLKFGSPVNQICAMFFYLPQIQFEEFVSNLRRSFRFLNEIEMEAHEIGNIFCSHALMLGSCQLKRPNTLVAKLHVGKKRIREEIQENPKVLKKWVMGSKDEPITNCALKSEILKTKLLLDLGIVENKNQIDRALKVFRCSGTKIQERFDYLVEAGLDRKDVCEMIKTRPQILGLEKDVLEAKIVFLLTDVGYPISYLINFPGYLCHSMQRVRLRLALFNWLKDEGKVKSSHSLATLVSCSDKKFLYEFVNPHPRGPEIWQNLKKEIYAE